jgi:photosystem II stability/assembly factor-like uncharacterized protein
MRLDQSRLWVGILSIFSFGAVNQTAAQSWSMTSAPIEYWFSVASSADGSRLAAAPDGDQIYISTDSGNTWNTAGDSPYQVWESIASSADGTKLLACGEPDLINYALYTSQDSGNTWTESNLSASNEWYKVASSADGTHLLAVCWFGPVYTSADSGTNWVQATVPMGSNIWMGCAVSASGRVMAAVSKGQPNGGIIAISTDYGATWSANNNAPQNWYWDSIACSADGTHMVAGALAGPYQAATLFTSSDTGKTWSSGNDAPIEDWRSVACSADGTRMIAGAGDWYDYEPIYLSTNSGANWTEMDAPPYYWVTMACSADCGKMVTAVGEHDITGPIYTAQTVVAPTLNIAPAGGNVAVSWTVPSTNFVLQQSTSLASPNWVNVTNIPVLVPMNLQDQVVITSTNPQSLFRLQTQ